MSLDEFNFISYNKITNQSDAFITSDELNCYVQYVPSSKALSHKIKKEAHTAGTTNDVNDYKIPDISPYEVVKSDHDFSMVAGEFVEVYSK